MLRPRGGDKLKVAQQQRPDFTEEDVSQNPLLEVLLSSP